MTITCRSPSELGPPSIGASVGTGYGPGSLSRQYWKVIGTSGWLPGTKTNGSPIGPPFQVREPKPACNWSLRPILAIYWSDSACVGSAAMLRFQMLSVGKARQLPNEPGVPVTSGVAVRVGLLVAVKVRVGIVVAVYVAVRT